jgi:hypothetical protein
MDPMKIAFVSFLIVLAIGLFLYFRPRYLRQQTEGFATIALDNETMPKCLLRDAEAQRLLASFQAFSVTSPNSAQGEAYAELKLIIQKLLCMDADITGSAAGPYSTYNLPFATAHDTEPVASFVGRCVRHAARPLDLEITMDKYEGRGVELIKILCFDESQRKKASTQFHDIVGRVSRNISRACLTEKASLDTPAGPRDPGYYTPPELEELRPYQLTGDAPQFI